MEPSTKENILTAVQRSIAAELSSLPNSGNVAPPTLIAPSIAMPDYVEHREGVTEIGKLSAEAVVREFETAAREIEAMGTELMQLVRRCAAMTHNAFAVTDELKDVAARYREEAKRIFLQIEDCSLVTAEISKTCTELKEWIAVPHRGPEKH